MPNTNKRKPKTNHSTTPATIEWPKDWASDEGWPEANDKAVSKGDPRSWTEIDQALRERGTSLAACVEAIGGPPANTKTKLTPTMEKALAFVAACPRTAYEVGCHLFPAMAGKRDTRLIARQASGTLRALMRRGRVVEAIHNDGRTRFAATGAKA